MEGEVLGVAADGGRGRGHQLAHKPVHRRAPGDFLGSSLLGGAQGEVRLLVLAPLEERAGSVDKETGFAFGMVPSSEWSS